MNEVITLDFHCTCCTLNCLLHVEARGTELLHIQGHSCAMGVEFAGKELLLQD